MAIDKDVDNEETTINDQIALIFVLIATKNICKEKPHPLGSCKTVSGSVKSISIAKVISKNCKLIKWWMICLSCYGSTKSKQMTNTEYLTSACLSLTSSSASETCLLNSLAFSCFASIVSAPNSIVEIPFNENPGGEGGGSSLCKMEFLQ